MAIGDFIRVALQGHMHGHIVVNTFMYRQSAGVSSGTTMQELLKNTFDVGVVAPILLAQSAEVVQVLIQTQTVLPLPLEATIDWPIGEIGALVDTPVPDTVACCIKRTGTLAGRANRGRIFLPGVGSSLYIPTTGKFITAVTSVLDNVAVAIRQTLTSLTTTDEWQPVILNKVTGAFVVVVNSSADPIARSQRRRELDKGK